MDREKHYVNFAVAILDIIIVIINIPCDIKKSRVADASITRVKYKYKLTIRRTVYVSTRREKEGEREKRSRKRFTQTASSR